MKSIYRSKTFWLAVAQSVVGVIAIFASTYPEVGALLMLKSAADVALRIATSTPIEK